MVIIDQTFSSIPPDCHHPKRVEHQCHFGNCPSCRQICAKSRKECPHLCPHPCHSAVLVQRQAQQKATMPWEQTAPQMEVKNMPCPSCVVPVPVTCLGGHETCDWPCHMAKPSSCFRPCGRKLGCRNHFCSVPCHAVINAPDDVMVRYFFFY